jgi:CheY-like chemotaxis protein
VTHPISCPSCGAMFTWSTDSDTSGRQPTVLLCSQCRVASHVNTNVSEPMANQGRIVIGHEMPAAVRIVSTVLQQHGYDTMSVRDGGQLVAACDPTFGTQVVGVIVDVAIPGLMSFEVISALRANPATAHLTIILLASVFERTRYKRTPLSLYGADGYVELHHVADGLPQLLEQSLARSDTPAQRLQSPGERAVGAGFRLDIDAASSGPLLARRMLCDLALYHEPEVAAGMRAGNVWARLIEPLDGARRAFIAAGGSGGAFDDEAAALAVRLKGRFS